MSAYAEVVLAINNSEVDKVFHYILPKELEGRVQAGSRVLVPFGRGNRNQEGYVTGFSETSDVPPERMKAIAATLEDFPVFTPVTLELAKWMRTKYYTTLANCLHCIMPAGIELKNDYAAVFVPSEDNKPMLRGRKKTLLEYIERNTPVSQREMTEQFGNVMSQLKELEKGGYIELSELYSISDFTQRIRMAFINEEHENFDEEYVELAESNPKQHAVLERVLQSGGMAVSDIRAVLHISDSPLKTLEKKGLLRIESVELRRDILNSEDYPQTARLTLTDEQNCAVNRLLEMLRGDERKPALIHGVTGSGKTEIYMRLIEECVAEGKQAIMLVPEIALTPQAVAAFSARFGDKVTVTHSRLSLGERYDQWKKARDGKVDVIIGPRSAIFTPFENLGIIIIDEEHEHTYKSETTPKYAVREVAEELMRLTGCMVVMGSATPSVTTFYEAQSGRLELITLKSRVNRKLPKVNIVDMRNELADGNRSIFSRELYAAISDNLKKHEQTIIFLNRRGHSTFISCRACGYVMKCESCNVNYTYHLFTGQLICHYCGRTEQNPQTCPVCGSKHIRYFGVGTQKVEEEIKAAFPEARILRMDMDTTSRKNSHERIIRQFAEDGADILVGTQMIAKGLNFPNVSLVGIIAADITLNMGDYRSAEVAYQLITQVSGRAGRAELDGHVYIQTYNPEHYSIICARDNDYEGFYRQEIAMREKMNYPPYSNIFQILFSGQDEKNIIKTLHLLLDIMKKYNRKGFFEMLGPAPCVISKLRGKYRWKLLVKGDDEELMKQFVFYCMDKLGTAADLSAISTNLTLNPVSMA